MTQKVRKAIIPAAGLGTRFLPATKAQPKEMLTIVDKPAIQYIVEEAINSGIEEILIITGRNKKSLEDHFDRAVEVELELMERGKEDLLKLVEDISEMVDIHYIRQKSPKGLGHAVSCARTFAGNEPVAVILPDDIVDADIPCLKQLIDKYYECGASVLGVQIVPDEEVSKYGIVDGSLDTTDGSGRTYNVKSLVEKPKLEVAPSNVAVIGRYVISPEIFEILEHTAPGAGGEIQLTDALKKLATREDMKAFVFEGRRFDAGDKLGFLQATVEFALKRPDLGPEFKKYLKGLIF